MEQIDFVGWILAKQNHRLYQHILSFLNVREYEYFRWAISGIEQWRGCECCYKRDSVVEPRIAFAVYCRVESCKLYLCHRCVHVRGRLSGNKQSGAPEVVFDRYYCCKHKRLCEQDPFCL